MRAGRGQPLAGAVRQGAPRRTGGCAAPGQAEDLRRGRRSAHSGTARPAAARGLARWTAPLLAKELGDVSDQHVWRFLRAQRIDLAGRKSWCLSSDPEFAAKAADIVGLYLICPTMRSSSRSMRSRRSRPWSGRRGISSCPMAARSTARPTNTSGAARPRCLPPSRSPPARSRPSIPSAGAASSSSTS